LYSPFVIAKKYIQYLFSSSNGKGHGVHSPYVYQFIEQVLNGKKSSPQEKNIEQLRADLLKQHHRIEVIDLGAGSSVLKQNSRKLSQVAKSSLKPFKYASLLHRIASFHQPQSIIELGTSLGITTAYLATVSPSVQVYTFEGVPAIADVAEANFNKLELNNIELIRGNFDQTLSHFLSQHEQVDFAYIDGNHRKAATLNYFEALLKKSNEKTMLIFDDIHWSEEMEEAWEIIKNNSAVTLSIDLFFIGIVFFNPDFRIKQHHAIRF